MSQSSPPQRPISAPPAAPSNLIQKRFPGLYAFWKFSRPHTIFGTSLSVLGLFIIASSYSGGVETVLWDLPAMPALHVAPGVLPLLALVACLCGNVYIVGLNQLEDVGIDRINKPHLPLASGEFSRSQAQMIVGITGILALLIAASQSYFLWAMVTISLVLGTAYSLPPLRLKRFPFWASFCIFTVRGIIVNLGLFLHFQHVLSVERIGLAPIQWQAVTIPSVVWALTAFILIFTLAIALFKDIPDLEGDRHYNINTLTVRLGQKAIFRLTQVILISCYLGMIVAGFYLTSIYKPLWIGIHLIAVVIFWLLSLRVNLAEKRAIARFYQFIWKLFFLEYVIVPAACWLQSVVQ